LVKEGEKVKDPTVLTLNRIMRHKAWKAENSSTLIASWLQFGGGEKLKNKRDGRDP